MKRLLLIAKLIPKLGYYNVGYALWYKIARRYGLLKRKFPVRELPKGMFFSETTPSRSYIASWRSDLRKVAERVMSGVFTWFSFHSYEVGEIPDWFYNPFEGKSFEMGQRHWTKIPDFDPAVGDIKIIWELSRMDWLTQLARGYKVFGERRYLDRINALLSDWTKKNPLNMGANWMCGQEASIRVMKLLSTAFILDQFRSPQTNLIQLVQAHVHRVAANITYAIVQNNNHGISEAAALYIGSAWLSKIDPEDQRYRRLKQRGRTILEERVLTLIQDHGTFAQRSMNYHRVVVDTMSFVLHMMDLLGEPDFSRTIRMRLAKLGEWQFKMTLGREGEAPNLGGNDGSMYENFHSRPYTDYRPSTQLFWGALYQKRLYDVTDDSESLYWRYGSEALRWPKDTIHLPEAEILDKQILLMRRGRAKIFLKIPDDRFRPGNDAFHLDLWIEGQNILCDSGTYSYNAGEITEHLKSVSTHNTVQFDGHEQMRKVSRFLYSDWIKADEIGEIVVEADNVSWTGAYTDYAFNRHRRSIRLYDGHLDLTDTIDTTEQAVCRLHLRREVDPLKIVTECKMTADRYNYAIHYMSLLEGEVQCLYYTPGANYVTIRWHEHKEA